MTHEEAVKFAKEWVEAWNRHDVEGVLAHYAADFEMTTPMIQRVMGIESGTLKGKEAVGGYWRAALKKVPELAFTLVDVTSGVDVVSVYYRAVMGRMAIETFFFNKEGLVERAVATYGEAGAEAGGKGAAGAGVYVAPAMVPESGRVEDYLGSSEVVDWEKPGFVGIAEMAVRKAKTDVEKARVLFEWVRDKVPHSQDAGHERVTCKASEVLGFRTGLCFAKAHLLAALLRAVGVPTGFCYQRMRYGEGSERMILHGFNGVYLRSLGKWIRVDARGNKAGVEAEFMVEGEKLAFPVKAELGEEIYARVYVEPLGSVVACLRGAKTVSEAMERLPGEIEGAMR
jgi:hypothetical protein